MTDVRTLEILNALKTLPAEKIDEVKILPFLRERYGKTEIPDDSDRWTEENLTDAAKSSQQVRKKTTAEILAEIAALPKEGKGENFSNRDHDRIFIRKDKREMIFVDSGGWFASVIADDDDHEKAVIWLKENKEPLFTTNYIVDETLTLLRARGENQKALQIGELFFNGFLTNVYYLNEEDVLQSWEVFQKFSDKDWSFTDCSSKFICEKFGITRAFAFDKHFRQFGTVIVVP